MGEAEKVSFIALPGKGGHSGLLPLKTMCPHPGGFDKESCFCFFFFGHSACGIIGPQPGIKPVPPVLEAQRFNHGTAREVLNEEFYSTSSRAGLLTRLGCVQGVRWWVS